MQIEEIITEVIIDSDGAAREDSTGAGSVPEVDSAATADLVVRIQGLGDRRTERLEVDE